MIEMDKNPFADTNAILRVTAQRQNPGLVFQKFDLKKLSFTLLYINLRLNSAADAVLLITTRNLQNILTKTETKKNIFQHLRHYN